jgi:hypothetical protein
MARYWKTRPFPDEIPEKSKKRELAHPGRA